MANSGKVLQVRLQEKIDTLANWLALDTDTTPFKPLAGEKINVKVPTANSEADGESVGYEIITKTGDGSTRFKDLPWDSALAADVYDWAKAAVKPSYSIGEITGKKELSISGAGTKVVSYNGEVADSLNIVGGTNVTVTPDATNNKITISSTNTDTKVNTTLATTTKAYLLGTSTTPTANAQAVETFADTGVYLDTTAGRLTASSFKGSLVGNADTATAFSAKKSVELTGDVTGTASSTAGWTVATTLANSGVTAGTYGSNTNNGTVEHDVGFKVPEITVDAKGRITSAAEKTVKISVDNVVSGATGTTADIGDNSTKLATTAFVANEIANKLAANDAMIFKGTIGTSGTVTALPDTHNAGWTYRVITAGTYAGIVCEIGDLIICIADGTAANNAHWTVAQTNIDGAVTGPTSATSNGIALFNGTTGKIIKNSSKTIVTTISGSANVPTDKAVKTYVDDQLAANTITASATDDDVVDITATGGANSVTITGAHAKKGPSSGYTSGNTTTSLSGAGSSATIKIPQITVDAYGHVTAAADEEITITLPEDQVIPSLSGSKAAATNQVISGYTVSGHTISPTAKTLTQGSNITITDDGSAITIANTYKYTLPEASASTMGGIKVSSKNSSAVTVNSESTTAGRYYPIELNSDGKAIVNVPWSNTTYNLFTATANGLTSKGGNANNVLFGDNTWAGATDYIVLCAGSASVNV